MELRIAHIIAGLGVGGAERNVVNLVNAMPCEYRTLVFLGPKVTGASFHNELGPEIEQHFCRIRRLNLPLGIWRLASLLRERQVNVVHTHMFWSSLYGGIAAKLAGVPVIVTSEHGENPWKRAFHRWIEKNVISSIADVRFCVSEKILELRRDVDKVPADLLRIAVNGTVLPVLPTSRSSNTTPLIGAVGRFIPAKAYPVLLEAVAILRTRGLALELKILGDGPEREKIEHVIRQLDLSDVVELPGMVTDVGEWYRKFDIYVSSSVREGQPVAMLEAMAWGLPIVATDVGAVSETLKSGSSGIVVPAGDAKALADALALLLDDEELRNNLGQKARSRVEEAYSVEAVADSHLSAYRNILAQKTGGTA